MILQPTRCSFRDEKDCTTCGRWPGWYGNPDRATKEYHYRESQRRHDEKRQASFDNLRTL